MTVTPFPHPPVGDRPGGSTPRALTVSCRTRTGTAGPEATIAVRGDVDAANVREFAHTVREAADSCSSVVLDLSEVAFMAFDGVSALYAISAHLLREGAQWCVVPSAGVARVLALCDPEGLIPQVQVSSLRGAEPA
ncbi:STAS domain-containing protein [Mycolicibacterium sp.]|uniref:STAS domain-containing protein n=1 Tax=Mycolicibacterium sp. TaxID=2320850 RepID=UPI003D09A062